MSSWTSRARRSRSGRGEGREITRRGERREKRQEKGKSSLGASWLQLSSQVSHQQSAISREREMPDHVSWCRCFQTGLSQLPAPSSVPASSIRPFVHSIGSQSSRFLRAVCHRLLLARLSLHRPLRLAAVQPRGRQAGSVDRRGR